MGAANRITLLRVVLTPLIAVALLTRSPGWQPFAIALVGLAGFTDLLDGVVARRRNQVTALGILLDPIADKFFIATVFICLVAADLSPAWVAVVIVGREFAVTALRMAALQRGDSVPVSLLGKVKMHAQVYAVILVLVGDWFSEVPTLADLGGWGLWIAAGITVWSGFDYFARSRRLVAE